MSEVDLEKAKQNFSHPDWKRIGPISVNTYLNRMDKVQLKYFIFALLPTFIVFSLWSGNPIVGLMFASAWSLPAIIHGFWVSD